MKTKFIILLSILAISLSSFTIIAQEKKSIQAVFDGHEDYGYNFIAYNEEEDYEYTLTFQNVSETVLKEFNLNSEDLIGDKFEITYQIKIEKYKDEDGFESENEILTILALKKL